MKAKFTLTVLGTALLLAAAIWFRERNRRDHRAASPTLQLAYAQEANTGRGAGLPQQSLSNYGIVRVELDWRTLESDSYIDYIKNLRSVGCPSSTIVDIVVADVSRLYDARAKLVASEHQQTSTPKYWQSGPKWRDSVDRATDARNSAVASVESERRQTIHRLLPHEVSVEDLDRTRIDTRYLLPRKQGVLAFLSDESRSKHEDLESRFNLKISERFKGGIDSQEKRQEFLQLLGDHENTLETTMTPNEWRLYQLQMSPLAQRMRDENSYIDLDSNEFSKIFDIRLANTREAGAERFGNEDLPSELRSKLRDELGASRAAEYETKSSSAYRATMTFAEYSGLSQEIADKLYDIRKNAGIQLSQLGITGISLDPNPQRNADGVRTAVIEEIQALLGSDLAAKYTAGISGNWLRTLGNTPVEAPSSQNSIITINDPQQ